MTSLLIWISLFILGIFVYIVSTLREAGINTIDKFLITRLDDAIITVIDGEPLKEFFGPKDLSQPDALAIAEKAARIKKWEEENDRCKSE